ncbi:MAG: two-component regulator propeller domain-containing protein [Prevotellaceae bacterium]|nr:two-component regulator propeller domain-containing protein [Prevotellaceae bacterium]
MKNVIVAMACCLAFCLTNANAQALDGGKNLTVLDMHAGLPHNFVNDIFEDSRGFVWVATYGGGLARYDGYSFMSLGFGSRNLSLRSNSCRNIVEDKFNRLWVSFDEGTDIINLNTYQKVTPRWNDGDIAHLLAKSSITVYRDTRDNMWLLTNDSIHRITLGPEGEVAELYSLKYTSNTPEVKVFDVNGDGTVWISTDGRLKQFVVQSGQLVAKPLTAELNALDNAYITGIMKYHGDIWIASNMGLYRLTPGTHNLRHYTTGQITHQYTTCLALGNDGKLLIGSLRGVNVYDPDTDSFSVLNTHWGGQFSSDFIHCILVRPGAVWVGTETSGMLRLSSRQFKIANYVHGDSPSSISPNCVNAIFVEPDETLWVGTVEGGLNLLKPGTDAFEHFTTANSHLSHNSVSTLAADPRRRLWIGTWGGGVDMLNLDNPSQMTHLDVGEKYNRLINYIGVLIYDKYNDGMWIGSNDGLFFYDFSQQKLILPFERCTDVRGCIGSLIDTSGRLWMGSQTGLRIIDLKNRKKSQFPFLCTNYMYKLDQPESKVVDKITSFCQTRDGNVWVGSNSYGIYRATLGDDGEWHFKLYTVEDGLANNSIKGIAQDANGRLWITTNYGLSLFNIDDETFTNFDSCDGFASSAFYWNSALAAGKNIYLGTDKGLSVVYGSNVIARGNEKLTFTQLAVDNQLAYAGSRFLDRDISVANRLHLHESDKSISISFSALQFSSEAKGIYCYRMKGFESQWTRMRPGEHSVRYTNLPSGRYTFEVKYLSAISGNVLNTASIDIIVAPYFWKSWWFVMLVLIAFGATATYIYKRRLEVMRERETMRLLTPIREALENSDNPEVTQVRIRSILDNQERFKESYSKMVEEDQLREAANAHPFMERLMKAMEKNYMKSDFDGDQLADALGMSRSLLVKKIKTETGQTTTQFIKDYRLNIARELLVQNVGNRNITEIAYRVGFNDPKYFTRCFTKKYGVSPSSFAETVSK